MLVSVRSNDLEPDTIHKVRIIVPIIDNHGNGIIQLEGIWLSKGGKLVPVEGSLLDQDFEDEDALEAENTSIGEKHKVGLNAVLRQGLQEGEGESEKSPDARVSMVTEDRKRILEVVTDNPGSLSSRVRGTRTGGADGLLAGVMGWEYLLGEMFSIDHVTVDVDGMCLTQDCIGGAGYPAGMGDVFFRR